jgi:hypothetical protein
MVAAASVTRRGADNVIFILAADRFCLIAETDLFTVELSAYIWLIYGD